MLSVSATLSASVGTLSVALVAPSANETDVGGAPDRAEPLSVTLTATVSAPSAGWSRFTTKDAAVPSVTGEVPAEMLATRGWVRVTVTV